MSFRSDASDLYILRPTDRPIRTESHARKRSLGAHPTRANLCVVRSIRQSEQLSERKLAIAFASLAYAIASAASIAFRFSFG